MLVEVSGSHGDECEDSHLPSYWLLARCIYINI
jgi:hypothetical protein